MRQSKNNFCQQIIYVIVVSALLSACQKKTDHLSSVQEQQISDTLEKIAIDFLRSWEPPFNPEAAVALFTQSDDFHLVIDGININSYSKWANGVPNFMADDYTFFTSYTHEIEYIETVVLSAKSGVVTMVYIWDSISKEGVHERTPGAATLTCREEENDWKIVHYHGSHGDPEIVKE